jgi:AraC-like DNA-binding protein
VHLSAYGLYGYALLCSTCYRETVEFATRYHYLAAPTVEMNFVFEQDEEGWDIEPVATDQVDHRFYAFLVCLQMGIHRSLHRDVFGSSFHSHLIELRIAESAEYGLPPEAANAVQFGCPRNRFHVGSDWIGRRLELGNELTFKQIVQICDTELSELVMQDGVSGQVRKVLLENAAFASNMDAIAQHMGLTSRTLRRHLKQEATTFSEIVDSTRAELSLRYLRSADLSTEEIAYVLGFSETASFVRAFKRWTGKTPRAYRMGLAA